MLVTTGYSEGSPYTFMVTEMAVVGSGYQIAHTLLSLRGFNAETTSEREAVYLAYEAKKYSENSPGVGPFTWMSIFKPHPNASKAGEVKEAWVQDRDIVRVYAMLEANRRQFGLQPIIPASLPNLRLTKADPSPPPPLPESPGGSDES